MDRDQSRTASTASPQGSALPTTTTTPIVAGVTQSREYEIVYVVKSTHSTGANMRVARRDQAAGGADRL